MISFDNFIAEDGIPIYLQIVRHIKRDIVSGVVVNGDEVPSRRVLSALLGINPNTIQKAYRILEEEKLMESHSGAKSYMVLNDKSIALVRKQLLDNDATSIVNSLKQMGLSKEEAVALYPKVQKMLDKLAKTNIIHKNKAANLKSKLAAHISKLG